MATLDRHAYAVATRSAPSLKSQESATRSGTLPPRKKTRCTRSNSVIADAAVESINESWKRMRPVTRKRNGPVHHDDATTASTPSAQIPGKSVPPLSGDCVTRKRPAAQQAEEPPAAPEAAAPLSSVPCRQVRPPPRSAPLREHRAYEDALQLDTAVFVAEAESAEQRKWAGEFDSLGAMYKFLEGNPSRLRAIAELVDDKRGCGPGGSGCEKPRRAGSIYCASHHRAEMSKRVRVKPVHCSVRECFLRVCRTGKCRKHYDQSRQLNA